ncbi:MAG: ferredoxin--NADP reductase [Phycisphaeraceae bacterium]
MTQQMTPTQQQARRRKATPRADAPDRTNATLIKRVDFNDELALFRVQPDAGEVPEFKPGQYSTLGLMESPEETGARARETGRAPKPRPVLRAYSIASSAEERGYLDFLIVLVPEGNLTPRLWQLGEGDRLILGPKITGKFTLDGIPDGKDLVAVATGTGLAPFLSMLRTYRGTGKWRKFVVIHGTRLAADLGYREELEQIAGEDDSVVYVPTVTREPETSNWQGLRGRVHVALEPETYERIVGQPLDAEQCHVLLCGNPAMIDQVSEDLAPLGFQVRNRENPEGNVHFESYW